MPLIRDAQFPRDKPAVLSFIDGLQRFEQAVELDRRVDSTVADEFFADITARVAAKGGAMLVAERDGTALGWAVVYHEQNDVYVLPEEREFAYISELYVLEAARGQGVGKQLIAACEAWARKHQLGVIMIGVLPGNVRADAIYRNAGYSTYSTQLRKYLR
ncbi:MAG TPA: GNAT family N-acetyltransferase [Rhizomicrobium sp.]|jgi:GNAT superfamily N-acetyltransferase